MDSRFKSDEFTCLWFNPNAPKHLSVVRLNPPFRQDNLNSTDLNDGCRAHLSEGAASHWTLEDKSTVREGFDVTC